jgi:type I restriction enzyme R subunit
MKLSKKEEEQVKKVAKDLLETLKKEKLVLDWKKKQQTRAAVELSIELLLDRLPICFTSQIYEVGLDCAFKRIQVYPCLESP